MTAPSYRSSTIANGSSNITLSEPSGTVVGDILYVCIAAWAWYSELYPVGGTSPSITTPSGWAFICTDFYNGNNSIDEWHMRMSVFRKVATSGSDSQTFTVDEGTTIGTMIAYQDGGYVDTYDTSSGSFTAGSISTSENDEKLLYFASIGTDANSGSFTPPGGMNERVDTNINSGTGYVGITVADETWASAGSTGTRTATETYVNDSAYLSALIAFQGVAAVSQHRHNTFEGGTLGQTVSPANSGTSGNAFNVVNIT